MNETQITDDIKKGNKQQKNAANKNKYENCLNFLSNCQWYILRTDHDNKKRRREQKKNKTEAKCETR